MNEMNHFRKGVLSNPLKEVCENIKIPEYKEYKDLIEFSFFSLDSECFYIKYENFDKRMKRIEEKNLKLYGKSLTSASLSTYFSPAIVEIQPDNEVVVINKVAYNLIRKYVTSKKFVFSFD